MEYEYNKTGVLTRMRTGTRRIITSITVQSTRAQTVKNRNKNNNKKREKKNRSMNTSSKNNNNSNKNNSKNSRSKNKNKQWNTNLTRLSQRQEHRRMRITRINCQECEWEYEQLKGQL